MATKRKSKKAGPIALTDVQARAARLQRELKRRREVARHRVDDIERDLRALAGALSKRANAVVADVEKHIRGLRSDLQTPARARRLRTTALSSKKQPVRKKK